MIPSLRLHTSQCLHKRAWWVSDCRASSVGSDSSRSQEKLSVAGRVSAAFHIAFHATFYAAVGGDGEKWRDECEEKKGSIRECAYSLKG